MKEKKQAMHDGARNGGGMYLLGLIGALIFFIQEANGFGEVIVAILKALVWPAFFVYDVLKYVS